MSGVFSVSYQTHHNQIYTQPEGIRKRLWDKNRLPVLRIFFRITQIPDFAQQFINLLNPMTRPPKYFMVTCLTVIWGVHRHTRTHMQTNTFLRKGNGFANYENKLQVWPKALRPMRLHAMQE